MGIYTEYLNRSMDLDALTMERQRQLARISELRDGRDVLVIAADFRGPRHNPSAADISINFTDILAVQDQIAELKGGRLDLILESPGGSGEAAEDIVRILRQKYFDISVIVPGWAKSAATIMTMAANEILMGTTSALGPIDAQIQRQGKVFSAEALLIGIDEIKKESAAGRLNSAYIPMLQQISPGELQAARNALKFAQILVRQWLNEFKFSGWTHHATTAQPVTPEERLARADEIAQMLSNHSTWLTHGRSIKIDDLRKMGLRITDYTETPSLADAITRYYTLLQMTFESTPIYKIFETPSTQIYRIEAVVGIAPTAPTIDPSKPVFAEVACPACNGNMKVQINFTPSLPIAPDAVAYPKGDRLKCRHCQYDVDLSRLRQRVESQVGKGVIA